MSLFLMTSLSRPQRRRCSNLSRGFDPHTLFALQVLERVALAYPRALFYPLLMTKASIREGAGVEAGAASGNINAQRLSKLTAITFDPSGETFAEVTSTTMVSWLMIWRLALLTELIDVPKIAWGCKHPHQL